MDATTNPPGVHALLNAPDEIILEIIYYLDLQGITALRKVCAGLTILLTGPMLNTNIQDM